jgi:hypothetical protein
VRKSRRAEWNTINASRVKHLRDAHIILVGKAEGKRLLVRPRLRWQDNIKFDLKVLQSDFFSPDFSAKILYVFLITPLRATCRNHHIQLPLYIECENI